MSEFPKVSCHCTLQAGRQQQSGKCRLAKRSQSWYDVVFTVQASGTTDEVLEKNTLWHRRLPHDTTDAQGAFCLSVDDR
jgi:hypothetical protein